MTFATLRRAPGALLLFLVLASMLALATDQTPSITSHRCDAPDEGWYLHWSQVCAEHSGAGM
ncbi:hypothetical protein H696_00017 [Fonticula alba]|uniref:Uncharacterized protein n=1 Tax=Fonticula alba TaxID=691883 RepID=A0A058ZEQ8_FONAL|nr:hypothetical protein H696_00017 [Fonticula alba]KCV72431.1 hypothetical protein H696_00017 [Fonticula alba]|eukprot:XP_009492132.1 hypothetical protein H696_00017 [Fonticula alba]